MSESHEKLPTDVSAPTDEYKVSQLKDEFCKQPEPFKKTKLFSDFTAEVQEFLISKVELESEECPGIAFYDASDCWFVATSRRVVWWKSKGSHYVQYHDLGKMECTEGPIVPKGCTHNGTTVVDGRRICKKCQHSSPWFFLESIEGRSFFMRIEPHTATRLWSCFKLMCQLDENHRTFE
jgi:hypothetical protein